MLARAGVYILEFIILIIVVTQLLIPLLYSKKYRFFWFFRGPRKAPLEPGTVKCDECQRITGPDVHSGCGWDHKPGCAWYNKPKDTNQPGTTPKSDLQSPEEIRNSFLSQTNKT
jgi:hypothetical protein